jgi:hypothetical protein
MRYRRRRRDKRMGLRVSQFKGSEEQMFKRELEDPVSGYGGVSYGDGFGYGGAGGYAERRGLNRSPENNDRDKYLSPTPPRPLSLVSQMRESSVVGNIHAADPPATRAQRASDKRVLITQVPTSKFSTNLLPRPEMRSGWKNTLTYDPDRPDSPPRFRSFVEQGLPPIISSYSSPRPLNQNLANSGPGLGSTNRGRLGEDGVTSGGGMILSASELRGVTRGVSGFQAERIRSQRGEIVGLDVLQEGSNHGESERLREMSTTLGWDRRNRGYRASSIGTAF